MIAWKPLQKASAFRLYCKAIGMNISEYDEVAKDISENAKVKKESKFLEEEKWKNLIQESEHFVGVVESISQSPCSMLLYDKPVSEEIGLIRTVDSKTKEIKMCCLLDGYNCDKYKYLKNDYLKTTVWAIIKDVCELANISIPSINEFNNLLDEKTYDIYSKGLTCTINQADSDYATELVKKYEPQSVSDMSAFVAIIRPGCASLLSDFIDRLPYTTGVKELDDLLVEGSHRMIYQELIMKYLIWLGIPETDSYDIIKKIAKKKFKEKELADLKSNIEKGWINQVGTKNGFEDTWTVVENAARYSFNASHSLSYAYDSLYGAYLKSHYPLEYYTVVLNYYEEDEARTNKLINELSYFGINLKPVTFGKSKDKYFMDRESNTIYKGVSSIKFLNSQVANELYDLAQKNNYNSFVELLSDIYSKTSCNVRHLEILIVLNYFSSFGYNGKLLQIFNIYNNLCSRKQIKKDDISKLDINEAILRKYAKTETQKLYKDLDILGYINEVVSKIKDIPIGIVKQLEYETEFLGSPCSVCNTDEDYYVVYDFKTYQSKYKPYIVLYDLRNGNKIFTKVTSERAFTQAPFKKSSILKNVEFKEKNKFKKTVEGYIKTDEKELVLSGWDVIKA